MLLRRTTHCPPTCEIAVTGHLRSRTLVLDGRRTSVRLEPAFWDALDQMTAATGQSAAQVYHAAPKRGGRADTLRAAVLIYLLPSASRSSVAVSSGR